MKLKSIIWHSLLLFGSWMAILTSAQCDTSSYGRCSCSDDALTRYSNVLCLRVPFDEIKSTFAANSGPDKINSFIVVPAAGSNQIPVDLLDEKQALSIQISSCADALTIDRYAFNASSRSLQSFSIVDCDVGKLTWAFLEEFNSLTDLVLETASNVQSLTVVPPLPSLKRLSIDGCVGINQQFILGFPSSSLPDLQSMSLIGNVELTDEFVELILSSLNGLASFESLSLRNNPLLTRVPDGLGRFPALNSLDMSGCHQILTIGLDSLSFFSLSSPVRLLDFTATSLLSIADEAFSKGFYGSANIHLNNNYLDEFLSTVYMKVLNEMYLQNNLPGRISIENNPIKCDDCSFAWLIRDFRQLLPFVSGSCLNKTRFEDLNPTWYDDQLCSITSTTSTSWTTSVESTTIPVSLSSISTLNSTETLSSKTVPTISTFATTVKPESTQATAATTEQPPSNESYEMYFYILYAVLGFIGLIITIGFIILGCISYKAQKSRIRSGLLSPVLLDSRAASFGSRESALSFHDPDHRSTPTIVNVSQLQKGASSYPEGFNSSQRPAPPGRVRGLRRTPF